jgi:hypothetical protein
MQDENTPTSSPENSPAQNQSPDKVPKLKSKKKTRTVVLDETDSEVESVAPPKVKKVKPKKELRLIAGRLEKGPGDMKELVEMFNTNINLIELMQISPEFS